MDDNEDTTAAMAAAMGFSSFGGQSPNKRRRFNPDADAVVASTSASTLPLHKREATTGSNATPLGTRQRNLGEIDLGMDGQEEDDAASGPIEAGREMGAGNDLGRPQYIDTSRPAAPLDVGESTFTQSEVHAIIRGSYDPNISVVSSPPRSSRGGGGNRGGRGGRQSSRGHGREEGRNWWEDYYDPSFVVNPWEKLENNLGIGPRGAWPSWDQAKTARA
ncbi:hypothetical protein F5Y15DRAFT_417706 [Xylariaceae sp. FL0016]|nr:hypothetical protein F5Y15DRAFT_417706 [Xylariaceae sp. FL0016]